MAVKLVVFDMAGTTVADEDNVAVAFQKAFSCNGIDIAKEIIDPLMGYHKPQAIQLALEKTGHFFDPEIIADIHDDFETAMMDFYAYDASVRPALAAEEIFQWLKANKIKIALNTGFSAAVAEVIVTRLRWEQKGLVDEFIGSDEVEKGRPYPFMIQELMKRCNVSDPEAVAKVGDTPVDVEEGIRAGCGHVIAITTGAAKEEELIRQNPTHIIHSLSQLKVIF